MSGELAEVSARAEVSDRGISHYLDPEMAELARKVPADPDGAFTADIHGDDTGVLSGLTRMSAADYLRVLDANGHEPGQPIRLLSCRAGAMDDGFAAELARASGCKVIAADTEVWSDRAGHLFASETHTDGFGEPAPDIPPNGRWHEFSPDGTKTRVGDEGWPPGQEGGFGDWQSPVGQARSRGVEPGSRRDDADGAERTDPEPSTRTDAESSTRADAAPATADQHDGVLHPGAVGPGVRDDGAGGGGGTSGAWHERAGTLMTTEPAPTVEERRAQADSDDTNDATESFLLLCTEYSAKRGGVVVFNRALAEGLADAGHRVTVRLGEDPSPYADVQRPNLRIVGPRDLPEPTVGPDGKTLAPDPRDYLGPEHDPENMPEHVDFVVGHTRFSGPDAKAERDAHYPDAKLIHFVHMVPEALGRVKENGDPPEPGEAAKGIENHAIERDLVAQSDLAAGVGPAITENVREMVGQARERSARTGESVATQDVHEMIPGMEFRDRPERPTEGRALNVLLFGRTDVGQKGGRAAAEVVSRLQSEGVPVRLVVRGVPAEKVERQKAQLSELMNGSEVDVRPFTTDRSDLYADFDDADVMIMTSRAEGFGLTAQEAAAAGVPVVVPSGSGFGRWLGESGQFSDELTGPSIVAQGFEDQVPVDAWVGTLRNVLQDYPAAQQRALDLQREFKDQQVTWATAVDSFVDAARRLQ